MVLVSNGYSRGFGNPGDPVSPHGCINGLLIYGITGGLSATRTIFGSIPPRHKFGHGPETALLEITPAKSRSRQLDGQRPPPRQGLVPIRSAGIRTCFWRPGSGRM